MLNDLLLLNKIKNGDVQAFEKLFRSYYKPLCYYADSFLNDMDSAEEIVQNIFYMFWKDRADLQIKLSVKSYLFQAVQNKSFSYLKHLQVMDVYREKVTLEEPEISNFSPADDLEYKELESKFTSLLQRLPERQRRIFCMVSVYQFRLAFCKVERCTVTFCKRAYEEDDESQWLIYNIPLHSVPATLLLAYFH